MTAVRTSICYTREAIAKLVEVSQKRECVQTTIAGDLDVGGPKSNVHRGSAVGSLVASCNEFARGVRDVRREFEVVR